MDPSQCYPPFGNVLGHIAAYSDLQPWAKLRGRQRGPGTCSAEGGPSLHTLPLDLHSNFVGPSGAHALAALKHALTFNLWIDSVGDSGVQALAALKETASLHTQAPYFQENSGGDTAPRHLQQQTPIGIPYSTDSNMGFCLEMGMQAEGDG